MALFKIKNRSTILFFLLIILLVVMTVCFSIVQSDAKKMEPPPKFVGSRYYYILIISFTVLFISFFGALSPNNDYLFYLTVVLVALGISSDLYITLGTKDKSSNSS